MVSHAMRQRNLRAWLAFVLVCLSFYAEAQDKIVTLEGTRIRGDQEVPLVLYLVPWQAPEARSLDRADEPLMLTRPISPIARSEFRRLIDYHQAFRALNAQSEAAQDAAVESR